MILLAKYTQGAIALVFFNNQFQWEFDLIHSGSAASAVKTDPISSENVRYDVVQTGESFHGRQHIFPMGWMNRYIQVLDFFAGDVNC